MKISRIEEMKNLDRRATEEYGIDEVILMENAGQAAYFTILTEFGIRRKFFVVICGIGNNGGDGLMLARKLHSHGARIEVFLLGNPEKFKGAAKKNFQILSKLPIKIIDSINTLKSSLSRCDAVIDAIFGTGLTRNVEGSFQKTIRMINNCGKTIFSLDIPSGINGNTGQKMDLAVRANYTITFGLPKLGNILLPGFQHGGKLYLTHISFPPELYNQESLKIAVNKPPSLPPRTEDGHKGDFGDVLFIAGSANYYGAPYYSARSFLKAGGGYSRLALPASIASQVAGKGSEIVFIPQSETTDHSLALDNRDNLLELAEQVDMVVIGPGLSLNQETQQLVRLLVKDIKKPLLIDGDGITAVADSPEVLKKRKGPLVITPHLGEMSRLIKKEVDEIIRNKIDILQTASQKLNISIVLKGAHSLIGYDNGNIYVNLSGNSGMATAGSGDVLTGCIAAMLGLGLNFEEAIRTGVFIHGLAGDLAAKVIGEDGLTADDIMHHLPQAVKKYRQDYHKIWENFYDSIYFI